MLAFASATIKSPPPNALLYPGPLNAATSALGPNAPPYKSSAYAVDEFAVVLKATTKPGWFVPGSKSAGSVASVKV